MDRSSLTRTKIVATLGPSTDQSDVLTDMVQAGMSVARINYSHGSHHQHAERMNLVRKISDRLHKSVAIMADLQGPKIRIASFQDDQVSLHKGDRFVLDLDLATDVGDVHRVGLTYKKLIDDVEIKDQLLLDDGLIQMQVVEKNSASNHLFCC